MKVEKRIKLIRVLEDLNHINEYLTKDIGPEPDTDKIAEHTKWMDKSLEMIDVRHSIWHIQELIMEKLLSSRK